MLFTLVLEKAIQTTKHIHQRAKLDNQPINMVADLDELCRRDGRWT